VNDKLRLKPLDARNGPQRIAAVRRVEHISYHKTPYMLAITPKVKGTGWLARLCWKVLHRIGALSPYEEKIHTYTFHESVQERLTDRVMFAADAIMREDRRPEDYAVVMGEPELREVWREMEMTGSFITMRTRDYRYSNYRGSVVGLNIHAVAGLSGLALIPKVLIEKNVDVAAEYRFALREICKSTSLTHAQTTALDALEQPDLPKPKPLFPPGI
jgi:hypothetical protein